MSKRRFITVSAALVIAGVVLALWLWHSSLRDSSSPHQSRVVVLMFHHIVPGTPDEYMFPADRFARLIERLKATGYKALTLDSFQKAVSNHASLPDKSLLLTFDDAYQDNYLYAFPILKTAGWPATFFVPTGKIEQSPDKRITWGRINAAPAMIWGEIVEMHKAGMDFGSHGKNHVHLEVLSRTARWLEVTDSRDALVRMLETNTVAIAYPNGRYNRGTARTVREAGYLIGFCTHPGSVDTTSRFLNPYAVPRINISGKLSVDEAFGLIERYRESPAREVWREGRDL